MNSKITALLVVIFTALVAASYFKGRADAREACTNKYEAMIANDNLVRATALTERLVKMRAENAALREENTRLNQRASADVITRIETVYRTVEKAVEKPVYVEGNCSISYDDVARVFDAVATAAGNN